jgi:hypothetical protein
VKLGENVPEIVRSLKRKLSEVLALDNEPSLRLDPANTSLGPKMKQVIELFQARNVMAAACR